MSLRLGFVAVIRPIFKGDSPRAALDGLEGLRRLGEQQGFEVRLPDMAVEEVRTSRGLALPRFAAFDAASAREAARQLAEADLDMVLIQLTTFATGDVLAPLLELPLPLGLWAIPEGSGGEGGAGPLPLNSLCSLNMTLSYLERPPVSRAEPAKWFYGAADSTWFRDRLAPTLAALRGLRALRGARVVQIGGTAPHFYGLEEEPRLPGVCVDRMPLAELFERVGSVPASEARSLAAQWRRREEGTVGDLQLERSAAVELALARVVAEGEYDAVALRCWPELPDETGTMACATLARLGDGGIAAACEGDVMGALSMLALQGMSGEPALLMDLSDFDERRGLLFWHCGNGPIAWASSRGTRLATHFNRDGLGTVRDMAVRPGPTTGLRLLRGGRGALVFGGEFREMGPSEPRFDGVRGRLDELRWALEPTTASRFLAGLLDRRLPHHFAFGQGNMVEGALELCGWLGARVVPAPAPGDILQAEG